MLWSGVVYRKNEVRRVVTTFEIGVRIDLVILALCGMGDRIALLIFSTSGPIGDRYNPKYLH